MKKFSLSIALCLCTAFAAFGQTGGTITGTVADASGAVIPGVSIQAKNTATGSTYQIGTSETGNFTIPNLPVGTYELSASLPGFKTFVRQNIGITADNVVRIDAKLEVGAQGDSVTVEAAAPLMKTETGEVSHNVNTDTLNSLPVLTLGSGAALGNIRNPLQSVVLMPGAAFANDNTLRINGMPSSSQAIRIEGQDATNGIWRQQNQVNQPSVDALQEVSVQAGNFDAEFGQAGGGLFNYTMKSGTNDYHGAAFDYFVNEFLNAGTPFTDRSTIGDVGRAGQHLRNTQRRNDYGFNVGGPIILGHLYDGHNKSFFFFNFEQFRESQFITTGIGTVPTAAFRNGDFFSALGPQLTIGGTPAVDPLGRPVFQNELYDPRTIRPGPDGTTIRDPFTDAAGNITNKIPAALMDPVALKILGMLPQPTNSGTVNNYIVPGYTNFRHTTIPSFKIDHNFDAKNRMSFYFNDTITNSPAANGFTQAFTAAAPTASRSYTYRINYDRTVSPTQLLHLGVGYLYTKFPSVPPTFDPNSLGFATPFFAPIFPSIGGISDTARGGAALVAAGSGIGSGFAYPFSKEFKPTANATYQIVKGNHSIKMGAELVVDGIQTLNYTRANGVYTFSTQQTGIGGWENGRGLNSTTGFGFASFLMGMSNQLAISQVTDSRLGNHSMAFYAQDSWKVTRKITLNYGLRYDFVTLLREQYGRMQSAAFNKQNASLGRLGATIYEANCGCQFNKNYPWALGPRLSLAYQFAPKTVLRAGAGIAYSSSPNNAFLSLSVPDFYNIGSPDGYALPATQLSDGNIFGPGNKFGNPPLVWPDFTRPNNPVEVAPGIRPPESPFISIDRNAGRPPRIFQWNFGIQHTLTNNLLVEAAYVGNRGAWWTAPLLATQNYNALTPELLKSSYGLDITNPDDRALLLKPVSSSDVTSRFKNLLNPDNVYPGFPASQKLTQALRPYPQWQGVPPFLGPPLGDTWYDSLQAKVTQRFAHNLTLSASYTFSKEMTNGANSDTSYLTPNPPIINDAFNRASLKQISSFGHPNALIVSFNYTTPGIPGGSAATRVASQALNNWTFGGVLRYQSGDLIRTPGSTNGVMTLLDRDSLNNPAVWGGGNTLQNKVSDQFLVKDPNCHCINPTSDLVLNGSAWSDAQPGTFGSAAPYYNNYRWQRKPSEALSLGRDFKIANEGKVKLNVRAEFQNVFNRLFYSAPSVGGPTNVNPSTPKATNPATGALTGGYGFVNYINGAGSTPRSGQIVARLIF